MSRGPGIKLNRKYARVGEVTEIREHVRFGDGRIAVEVQSDNGRFRMTLTPRAADELLLVLRQMVWAT